MSSYRDYIEFIYDNSLKRVFIDSGKDYSPTTTLLEFLRKDENHKGTKEGCAEGDCGACTVIVVEYHNGVLEYKACNACLIFLPQVHGKQIITVENLQYNNELHPVQKAMVEMEASQCGFCTPGFVMSLFGLYKSNKTQTDDEIMEAFAGNLCRCTGYKSIIKAARQALHNIEPDSFSKQQHETIEILKNINRISGFFEKKGQKYFQPVDLPEALQFLDENQESIKLGGSSDIALRVTKNHENIDCIIDLSQLHALNFIKESLSSFTIGSQTPLQKIKDELGKYFPQLNKILSVFGSKQIRNVATLAGNIASASPISDMLPLLMVLHAKVLVKSIHGERTILIHDFISGYRKTVMDTNEMIVHIIITKPPANYIIDIEKHSKRLDLDIATVSLAMRLKLSAENIVEEIMLIYGGMAAYTKRASHMEGFLLNKPWSKEIVEEAGMELLNDFNPISDARSSAQGRVQIAKNLLLKLWLHSQNTTKI